MRLRIDPNDPDFEALTPAIRLLREGGLVAFPTETVYGLGANALDVEGVRAIFEAKERPETHPLIVHVGASEHAERWADPWPPEARRLAERFWPGPLTLIVPRDDRLPDVVTGGLETVGLRMPDHPVGLELLRRTDRPIAAPSANPHTRISPTRAEHVVRGLGDAIDLVVDGGPTDVGIESTVLSLCSDPPTILRPGMIGRSDLESVIGTVQWSDDVAPEPEQRRASPGLSRRHYAPEARVLFESEWNACSEIDAQTVGWLALGETHPDEANRNDVVEMLPSTPEAYAEGLYEALHALDRSGVDAIVVQSPPRTRAWRAVWNRLDRAADSL